jgi:hypothetical protein
VATATECHPVVHYNRTGRPNKQTDCTMVWNRDGAEHAAVVTFSFDAMQPGSTATLMVDGDRAERPDAVRTAFYLGWGLGSVGLLIAAALWLTGLVPMVLPPPSPWNLLALMRIWHTPRRARNRRRRPVG